MRSLPDLFFMLLFLTAIASCTSPTTSNPLTSIINSATFISDSGQTMQAVYRDDDTVTLIFPDSSTETLNLAISASGARYVSGTNEWWEHQGEATYSINDEQVFSGKLRYQPAN